MNGIFEVGVNVIVAELPSEVATFGALVVIVASKICPFYISKYD